MKKRGFTLIELVVVMAIIAVLSLLVVGAIMAARQQAAKTAVTGDTKTYEVALESYATDNANTYPKSSAATKVDTATTGLNTLLGTKYLTKIPDTKTIWYITDNNGTKYTLVGCPTDTTGIGALTAGTAPSDDVCTGASSKKPLYYAIR